MCTAVLGEEGKGWKGEWRKRRGEEKRGRVSEREGKGIPLILRYHYMTMMSSHTSEWLPYLRCSVAILSSHVCLSSGELLYDLARL